MALGILGARSLSAGRPFYGTGSDGNIVLDGVTDFAAFAVRTGAVYVLSRDLYAADLTIAPGVTLEPWGYRVYASGELENRGTISRAGVDANSRSGGAHATNVNATLGTDSDGGFGNAGGQNGGAGTQGELRAQPYHGGSGGGGGQSSTGVLGGAGRAASAATGSPTAAGLPSTVLAMTTGHLLAAGGANYLRGGHGGGGGGAAVGVFGNGSGGGGEGGGVLLIAAYEITNAGTITARGGHGAPALAADSGGGGGGAGGVILLAYDVLTDTGSISVAGGNGGAGAVGGTAGGNGTAGSLFSIDMTAR